MGFRDAPLVLFVFAEAVDILVIIANVEAAILIRALRSDTIINQTVMIQFMILVSVISA